MPTGETYTDQEYISPKKAKQTPVTKGNIGIDPNIVRMPPDMNPPQNLFLNHKNLILNYSDAIFKMYLNLGHVTDSVLNIADM